MGCWAIARSCRTRRPLKAIYAHTVSHLRQHIFVFFLCLASCTLCVAFGKYPIFISSWSQTVEFKFIFGRFIGIHDTCGTGDSPDAWNDKWNLMHVFICKYHFLFSSSWNYMYLYVPDTKGNYPCLIFAKINRFFATTIIECHLPQLDMIVVTDKIWAVICQRKRTNK